MSEDKKRPRGRSPSQSPPKAPPRTLRNNPLDWVDGAAPPEGSRTADTPAQVRAAPAPKPPAKRAAPRQEPAQPTAASGSAADTSPAPTGPKQTNTSPTGDTFEGTEPMTTDSSASEQGKWLDTPATACFEKMATPILIADADYVIRFANDAIVQMFKKVEDEIRVSLPHFRANDLVGKNVDIFHVNPTHQRRILDRMAGPHDGEIHLGEAHIFFTLTPMFNPSKRDANDWMIIEFEDRSAEIEATTVRNRLNDELVAMAAAHSVGDIDVYVDAGNSPEATAAIATRVNEMVQAHIRTKQRAMAVVAAWGEGNFDILPDPEHYSGKRMFIYDTLEAVRVNMKKVVGDITELSDAILRGELSNEVDASGYKGEYKEIIESFARSYNSLNLSFSNIKSQVDQMSQTVIQMNEA